MSTIDPPQFLGDVLAGSTKYKKLYGAIGSATFDAKLGDTVAVNLGTRTASGIILALWEEGTREKNKKRQAELLWFDDPPISGMQAQELLITPSSSTVSINQVLHPISVTSHSVWKQEEKRARSKAKKARSRRYFCEFGYLDRAQIRTKKIHWETFYTEDLKEDLVKFRQSVKDFVLNEVRSKLPERLASKIAIAQTKQQKEASTIEEDTGTESESLSESSFESSADVSSDDSIPRTTRLRRRLEESAASQVADAPSTPKKRKRPNAVTPRTPRGTPQAKMVTNITTPGSQRYRVQAPLEVTPLPIRVKNLLDDTTLSPHQLARQRLHVAEVPTSLPCREEEFSAIYEQVESAILENESALVYVSGTPGTGKTATVRAVIKVLLQRVEEGELFPFRFVEINGMKIPDPTQAYCRLWEALGGQRVTANHALTLLQNRFSTFNTSQMPCVVLMDELDQLTTTKQEVMYNFFQWPNMPNTRLIVVAVANTMDLPERTLAHKVSSRLGLTRIPFSAYTKPQLSQIIMSRLSSVESVEVEEAAINYACARVSRVSGDARRALDICRRAFELAEPGFNSALDSPQTKSPTKATLVGKLTMDIMIKACNEMTSTPLQVYLKCLPFISKITLKALTICLRRSGLTDTSLGEVIEDTTRICKVNTVPELQLIMGRTQPFAVIRAANELADAGVIYLEQGKGERFARVKLKVSESDLLSSWAEDALLVHLS